MLTYLVRIGPGSPVHVDGLASGDGDGERSGGLAACVALNIGDADVPQRRVRGDLALGAFGCLVGVRVPK